MFICSTNTLCSHRPKGSGSIVGIFGRIPAARGPGFSLQWRPHCRPWASSPSPLPFPLHSLAREWAGAGTRARGDARQDSNLDLLIILPDGSSSSELKKGHWVRAFFTHSVLRSHRLHRVGIRKEAFRRMENFRRDRPGWKCDLCRLTMGSDFPFIHDLRRLHAMVRLVRTDLSDLTDAVKELQSIYADLRYPREDVIDQHRLEQVRKAYL